MLYPATVSYSTLHLCLVSRSPEKWFLVLRWSSLQQDLPTPDDVESEQSSHNTKNMNVAESMSLQVGRPATESRKWALLWRACHFYETSSVHLALWLNHCPAHILAHMMNLFLTWCFAMCTTSVCWYVCGENKSLSFNTKYVMRNCEEILHWV